MTERTHVVHHSSEVPEGRTALRVNMQSMFPSICEAYESRYDRLHAAMEVIERRKISFSHFQGVYFVDEDYPKLTLASIIAHLCNNGGSVDLAYQFESNLQVIQAVEKAEKDNTPYIGFFKGEIISSYRPWFQTPRYDFTVAPVGHFDPDAQAEIDSYKWRRIVVLGENFGDWIKQ